jgi:antitoxin (DNA-binding transcriptional repressor) of toxin-antitoxin stability system
MKTISFSEFRSKASAIMDLVEKSETVRVLRHRKAVAKIVLQIGAELNLHGSAQASVWWFRARHSVGLR